MGDMQKSLKYGLYDEIAIVIRQSVRDVYVSQAFGLDDERATLYFSRSWYMRLFRLYKRGVGVQLLFDKQQVIVYCQDNPGLAKIGFVLIVDMIRDICGLTFRILPAFIILGLFGKKRAYQVSRWSYSLSYPPVTEPKWFNNQHFDLNDPCFVDKTCEAIVDWLTYKKHDRTTT